MNESMESLIQKHLDGQTSAEEAEALSSQIVSDAEVRTRYLKAAQVHGALADEVLALDLSAEAAAPTEEKKKILSFTWPQQLAAALVAGAFVGLVGFGVVWAVNSPKSEASFVPVANGDFQSLSGPVPIGFPAQFGRWSGDPAEVVADADGNHRLRFLKTANVTGNPDGGASACNVFQLIDLSSLQRQWNTGDSDEQFSLELTALFRREEAPTDADLPRSKITMGIQLYRAEPESIGRGWPASFDSVKLRLDREQPLSFLEFNYMILQAYDFIELRRKYNCTLQMGGSDQWGNIVNGIDLARRVDGVSLHALTTPLLTTSSGAKMGKTAAGAVWLNEDMLSVYDYWQFWRNTEDADVGRLMRLFTELPLDEIERLECLEGQELNEAKKTLANEATGLVHGRAAAETAAETAHQTFEQGAAAEGLPTVEIARAELDEGFGVLRAIVAAGLAGSNGEARRLVRGGGARINDVAITDERATLVADDITDDGVIKVSAGKKRHALLRPR